MLCASGEKKIKIFFIYNKLINLILIWIFVYLYLYDICFAKVFFVMSILISYYSKRRQLPMSLQSNVSKSSFKIPKSLTKFFVYSLSQNKTIQTRNFEKIIRKKSIFYRHYYLYIPVWCFFKKCLFQFYLSFSVFRKKCCLCE